MNLPGLKVKILGTGAYHPKKILSNKDLEKMVDTDDQWIYTRTGIRERRICSTEGGEWPSDMAMHATREALDNAGLSPNQLDMIIFATVTPDQKLPNTASILQQKLEITNQCTCLDISVACSGFVYGANMATSLIRTGQAERVLVVGAEMLSQELDWSDRNVCILFGDGCGCAIFGPGEERGDSDVYATYMGADGAGREFFDHPIGGAVNPITMERLQSGDHFMRMKGNEMFKVASRTLAQNARWALERAGMRSSQVDWLIPHQANIRIIEAAAKMLDFPMERVVLNIEKYGNTSAASVPMALHEGIAQGRIKRGEVLLFNAFGAGLTFGSTLLRY